MKRVYKNTFLNIGAQVFVLLVMFFAMPWIVNGLGDVAFAILSLVWTVITYFTLWDLGIGRAVTKFVAEKRGAGKDPEIASVVHISTIVSILLGLFFGVLLFVFRAQLVHLLFKVPLAFEETVQTALTMVAVSMPILLLQSSFRGVIMGFDRFDFSNLIQIMNGILQWGGALILVLLHYGVLWVIAFVMLTRLGTTVVMWGMISRIMKRDRIRMRFDISLLKDILVFGGWAMVSQVVSPILQYAERFILSALVATGLVTFYVVPYEATSRMLVFSLGLVSALFPAMSEIHGVGGLNQDFRRLYSQSERILIFAFLPVGTVLFVFAPEILKVWMGASFAENAAPAFEILAFTFMINSVSQLPFTVLQAVGRPDLTGKTHLIELPIHLCVAFLLIHNFGLVGAAVATLIRIVLDMVLLFWFASRTLGLELGFLRGFWNKLAVPIACLLCGVGGAILFRKELLPKSILTTISLLLYAIVVYRFSLEENEKRIISRFVLRRAGG